MKLTEGQKTHPKRTYATYRLTIALFVIYWLLLCWILIAKLGVRFSYMEKRTINLLPFREWLFRNGQPDSSEMILNVVVFIPLGIYAGILFEGWKIGKTFVFFFLTSFLVEALQFALAVGSFDSTDIVTNTMGGVMGYILLKTMEKLFKSKAAAHRFITVAAAAGTFVLIVLLVLLKLDKLPIRYQ